MREGAKAPGIRRRSEMWSGGADHGTMIRPPPDGCGRQQAQRMRADGGEEIRACGRPAASEDADA